MGNIFLSRHLFAHSLAITQLLNIKLLVRFCSCHLEWHQWLLFDFSIHACLFLALVCWPLVHISISTHVPPSPKCNIRLNTVWIILQWRILFLLGSFRGNNMEQLRHAAEQIFPALYRNIYSLYRCYRGDTFVIYSVYSAILLSRNTTTVQRSMTDL